MGRYRTWLGAGLVAAVVALAGSSSRAEDPASPEALTFDAHVLPFLEDYCLKCHDADTHKAGLDLEPFQTRESVLQNRKVWEKVVHMLRENEMPPGKRKKPPAELRVRVTDWINAELDRFSCDGPVDPGHVTMRRLNRVEYDNTVRDLLGIEFEPAADFPADEVGYGFDNIGDVLSLPPLLLEKYLDAAEQIMTKALESARSVEPARQPTALKRLLSCSPADAEAEASCAREVLTGFSTRAFRRPATNDEVERLVAMARAFREAGDSFEDAVAGAMQAVLISPHFLFRVEVPNTPSAELDDYELASRLSYFLWSSMPDGELFELAAQGRLRRDEELEAQARRMLADPRSSAFVENFASQWLQTRLLERVEPDPGTYPGFAMELRADMERETLLFFREILRENRSVLEFIDGQFTYLNDRLARHYGIEGISGPEFRRVALEDSPRSGVLTHASILTLTSNPTRTSPVKRGKWILEQIMGTPPPPPPPNVEQLSEAPEAILSGSLRQRMEKHREDPNCAQCHERMDPVGFAFENFDGVGRWRNFDGQFAIDPSGVLPDGSKFDGPDGLKAVLRARKADFCRNLAEKILTYALGRGLEYYDKCAVDQIVETLETNEYRIVSMIVETVKTTPFRTRREGKSQS